MLVNVRKISIEMFFLISSSSSSKIKLELFLSSNNSSTRNSPKCMRSFYFLDQSFAFAETCRAINSD